MAQAIQHHVGHLIDGYGIQAVQRDGAKATVWTVTRVPNTIEAERMHAVLVAKYPHVSAFIVSRATYWCSGGCR